MVNHSTSNSDNKDDHNSIHTDQSYNHCYLVVVLTQLHLPILIDPNLNKQMEVIIQGNILEVTSSLTLHPPLLDHFNMFGVFGAHMSMHQINFTFLMK